jgi:DNA-binding NtrC family response regulator
MAPITESVDTVSEVAWQEAVAAAQLIGDSRAHRAVLSELRYIAQTDVTVLIEGETGSGKELAARAIHYGGPRRSGPFVPVNCGALPDALLESELFGVERGAFTDARQSRRGLVAEAEAGTLFLDEVDALSPRAQVALLRFLQDQRYRPLGSTREMSSNVRLIAATNRPLEALVMRGPFRADLLYRLKILHLTLPALRDRTGDAERLAEHFIAELARRYGRPPLPLHPQTRHWLREYSWPGNVRELENWAHRQFLMCRGDSIVVDEVADLAASKHGCPGATAFAQAKAEAVRRFEQDYLQRVLHEAGGNVTRAARLAGKERRAFGKLLKKYGLAAGRLAHAEPAPSGF